MTDFRKYLNEGYTKNQLSKINHLADTVSIKVVNFEGNKTNFLGMNEKVDIDELISFLKDRKKVISGKY